VLLFIANKRIKLLSIILMKKKAVLILDSFF